MRKVLQDFVAPFHLFVHSEYIMEYISMEDELGQTGITLQSSMLERTSLKTRELAEFSFFVDHERIERFVLKQDGRVITASIPENTESLPI
ncbi:MAG: hypothetical protein IPH84_12175 [Bacteroidales bacterium]|nr:hypothetical protein [Bacteroidales bacterium]